MPLAGHGSLGEDWVNYKGPIMSFLEDLVRPQMGPLGFSHLHTRAHPLPSYNVIIT